MALRLSNLHHKTYTNKTVSKIEFWNMLIAFQLIPVNIGNVKINGNDWIDMCSGLWFVLPKRISDSKQNGTYSFAGFGCMANSSQ